MFRFLHAADIHLDSPLRGLERYEGAPVDELRCATREALKNLVDLAISRDVRFLLIAGDLYDGDWKDYHTGLFFAKEMSRLRGAGINVYVVFGNHDAASQITKKLQNIPSNVFHFPTGKPGTEIIEDLDVAIHGQGFSKRVVSENISSAYPEARQGYFNIGILHTSSTGRLGHEPYAPCTVDDLHSKNYDYWALGHVHKREILHEDPWIIFPGNIQGRHIRETGAKGCTLVSVEDEGNVVIEHHDLDVMRWESCSVDGSGAVSPEEIIDRLRSEIRKKVDNSDGRPLALRVFISGRCNAHDALTVNYEKWANEIRAASTDVSGGRVWIEKIKISTGSPLDMEKMSERDDPIGSLLRFIRDMESNPADMDTTGGDINEIMDMLAGDFVKLKAKLPSEVYGEDESPNLENPEKLREMLEHVKQILVSRLLANT